MHITATTYYQANKRQTAINSSSDGAVGKRLKSSIVCEKYLHVYGK